MCKLFRKYKWLGCQIPTSDYDNNNNYYYYALVSNKVGVGLLEWQSKQLLTISFHSIVSATIVIDIRIRKNPIVLLIQEVLRCLSIIPNAEIRMEIYSTLAMFLQFPARIPNYI